MSRMKKLLQNRRFWFTTGAVAASGLIFYEWYSDRYATARTRLNRIRPDYQLSRRVLHNIRQKFLEDMKIGLNEPDDLPTSQKKSSLKMLSTKVYNIPTGNEDGIFYTLDWGGSNYRVIRMNFHGQQARLESEEYKVAIAENYQKTKNPETLFDYLSEELATHMKKFKEFDQKKNIFAVGFTFSFPMVQPKLDQGILMEWTKGFDIPGVIGKDVVAMMHRSFEKKNIPARIEAIVNDTVGTLLSCAYEHENVRIGLILGTGSNACYIEPERNDEVINIEWGNFYKGIPRMPIDFIMDEYTPNRGVQFMEKMISGYYLGEMSRLLALEVFREKITNYGAKTDLNHKWKLEAKDVSKVLSLGKDYKSIQAMLNQRGATQFTADDCEIFQEVCQLIVNRSADMAAMALSCVLEKTGVFQVTNDPSNPQVSLNPKYIDKNVTIGIDGSVFQKTPGYEARMRTTLNEILGEYVAEKIMLVHSADGSGRGAALAVAAKKNN